MLIDRLAVVPGNSLPFIAISFGVNTSNHSGSCVCGAHLGTTSPRVHPPLMIERSAELFAKMSSASSRMRVGADRLIKRYKTAAVGSMIFSGRHTIHLARPAIVDLPLSASAAQTRRIGLWVAKRSDVCSQE